MQAVKPATAPRRHARIDEYASTPARILGLDGLRAIAVAAVVVYHLGTGGLPGGFLGVDVFFVISGFLITTLLMKEVSRHGRVRVVRFYARRARRLLPALFAMLAGTAVLVATVARDSIDRFTSDVPAALLYVSNWWYIADDQSYFELIGRGNLLAHLWSLAVEEQFYLIWPGTLALVCALAVARGRSRRRSLVAVALSLALASTVAMAVLSIARDYPLGADPTRVYFGTDTHAMSVLIGAALAGLWRPGLAPAKLPGGARASLAAIGAALLAVLGWFLVNVNEYTPWMYRGGFLVVAVLVAAIIATVTHPASLVGRLLDAPPLRWIGERSYGIYLWHWPIFLVLRPGIDIPWQGAWIEAGRLALVVLVAAASYRYIETPIRHGALGRWWSRVRERGLTSAAILGGGATRRRSVAVFASAIVLVGVVTVSFSLGAPTNSALALGSVTAMSAEPEPNVVAPVVATASAGPDSVPSAPAVEPLPAKPDVSGLAASSVAIYGDSVALWAADVLKSQMPGVTVDAATNRSPANIMGAVAAAHRAGTLRPIVIMHMGTAGPVSAKALRASLDALTDRTRVVLVSSTARFAYVGPSNAVMRDVAKEYSNVVFADWKTKSKAHPEWFEDGLHLSSSGKPAFAEFLALKALAN